MSAYIIFNYKILDREKIDQLTEMVEPFNKKYNAEVIVGSPVKAIEGEALPNMVIYKFESFQAAQAWYNSEEHKESSVFRHAITKGWATIVPGVDETDELLASGYFEK